MFLFVLCAPMDREKKKKLFNKLFSFFSFLENEKIGTASIGNFVTVNQNQNVKINQVDPNCRHSFREL